MRETWRTRGLRRDSERRQVDRKSGCDSNESRVPVVDSGIAGRTRFAGVGVQTRDEGVYAEAVAYIGLSGQSDAKIWDHALENDFTVVTSNARDFIRLPTWKRTRGSSYSARAA